MSVSDYAEIDDPRAENEKADELLETFDRFVKGVTATNSSAEKNRLLQDFISAASAIEDQTRSLASRKESCLRFLNLYEETNRQRINGYTQVYQSQEKGDSVPALLKARLEVLRLIETAMYATVLTRSEAGRSMIDRGHRTTCHVPDRESWEEKFVQSHQTGERLQIALFGEPSAVSPVFEQQEIREELDKFREEVGNKKLTFYSAEFLASIVLWEKGMRPANKKIIEAMSKRLAKTPRNPRVALAVGLLSSVAYVSGLVFIDRQFRENIEFLQPEPVIEDASTLSDWERLMNMGEAVVQSPLESPALYSAYLKLIAIIRRQQALGFISVYENELKASHGHRQDLIEDLKTRLESQIEYLAVPLEQRAKELIEEIDGMYGYKVRCDSGVFDLGIIGDISASQCLAGLIKLETVFADIEDEIDRLKLLDYEIMLTDDSWEKPNEKSKVMEIPFRATTPSMKRYLMEVAQ